MNVDLILKHYQLGKISEVHAKYLLTQMQSYADAPYQEPIAIIGYSCKFPDSDNADEFWQLIANKQSAIKEIPKERWALNKYFDKRNIAGKTYCKWGGFLQNPYHFDEEFFEITPNEARYMDPQSRLFLQEAWQALEHSGYTRQQLDQQQVGVYVGVMLNDYLNHISEYAEEPWLPQVMQGNSNSILAARLAYHLNLKGPAVAIDTACSSSLVATHLACQSLWLQECDMMVVGGVTLYLTEKPFIYMSQAQMLSPTGQCRPFDKDADGMLPGEGVGAMVLKCLSRALDDRDHIHAVIVASGVNQDGKTLSITAPSAQSQLMLYRNIYSRYQINPPDIDYLECHGTGTPLGDPIEWRALAQFFKKNRGLVLGSIKANIGHPSAAAGMAGLLKIIMSLKHKQFPPSINFNSLNPEIDACDNLMINKELAPWGTTTAKPRFSGLNSFGFSGTNAHLVLMDF